MAILKDIFDNFTPKNPVSWFNIDILVKTLIQDSKTRKISDQREESDAYDMSYTDLKKDWGSMEEVWIDYIADTGDGFNETLTTLFKCIGPLQIQETNLPSGDFLLCGGDQVYPFATSDDYANRFFGPLMAAQHLHSLKSKQEDEETNPPQKAKKKYIFALPGNHDWYGGLYAFREYFCGKRKYEGYFSQQTSSYYAINVIQNVWIWMVDIQLSLDINKAQIAYFTNLCKEQNRKSSKDKTLQIILCIAQPFWFQKSVDVEDQLFNVIDNFITQVFFNNNPFTSVDKSGKRVNLFLELKLIITGDIHHYTRFQMKYHEKLNQLKHRKYKGKKPIADPLPLITAGGGGAYTYPTHHIEDKVKNKSFLNKINNQTISLLHYYPDSTSSVRLRHSCIWNILLKNPLFTVNPLVLLAISFIVFVGYFPPFTDVPGKLEISHWPYLVLYYFAGNVWFYYTLATSLDKFTIYLKTYDKIFWYGLQIIFSVIKIIMFYLLVQWLNHTNDWLKSMMMVDSAIVKTTIFAFEFYILLVIAAMIQVILMGLYLYLCNVFFKIHDNEVFSISKINRFKNFLKIKIDKENITIYPIGIDRINSEIKADFEEKRFQQVCQKLERTQVEMIEPPIKISLKS